MKEYSDLVKIGEGAFGNVFKAQNKQGKTVALKMIKFDSPEEGIPGSALREISVLKALNQNTQFTKLIEVIYVSAEQHLVLVFQYYQCDLKKYIKDHDNQKGIPEKQIKKIMKQILTGLSILHQKKIVHRDIKPQNIMLDNKDDAKIADFGLARYVLNKNKTLTREVQTLWYRAPEVMMGMKHYTFTVDIWSAGCIFAELYLKRPLFLGSQYELQQIYKVFQILGTPTKYSFPKWKPQPLQNIIKKMPAPAMSLLQEMLKYDPEKRISAFEALNHPYFQSIY